MVTTISAVGDVFLRTLDGSDPFEHVRHLFMNSDINFCNLETALPLGKYDELPKSVVIKASPQNVRYLRHAGFGLVNIANNHIFDYGVSGFQDTIESLSVAKIDYIGTADHSNALHVCEVRGTKIGFWGANEFCPAIGKNKINILDITDASLFHKVEEWKKEVDFLVLSLHWGFENVDLPQRSHQTFARTLIENGVDVILGHHPHCLQGIERWGNGLIIYSMGNFNFRGYGRVLPKEKVQHNYETCVFNLTLNKETREIGLKLHPIEINKNWQPRVSEEIEILDKVKKLSLPLKKNISRLAWYQEASIPYITGNTLSYVKRIRKHGLRQLYLFLRWLASPQNWGFYLGLILCGIRKITGKS